MFARTAVIDFSESFILRSEEMIFGKDKNLALEKVFLIQSSSSAVFGLPIVGFKEKNWWTHFRLVFEK